MKFPPFPVFFPDATRGVIKTLDSKDIEDTKTLGVLVNTFHLLKDIGIKRMNSLGGIKSFMDWKGFVISDSGGFQVGSLVKNPPAGGPELGKVTDYGVTFKLNGTKTVLTPESSMEFQMSMGSDMVVVLDDFDAPNATTSEAVESVERTILWAKRAKEKFLQICKEKKFSKNKRPYILGVIQGGRSKKLRRYCVEELVKIGFDGLGYGGEEKVKGSINVDLAKYLKGLVPKNYLMYALGVGKPCDIVNLAKLGYDIFDCVLPTRDARHKRLYVYNAKSMDKIDINKKDFYSYFDPARQILLSDTTPVSLACDCLLCVRYSKAYLAHLFKIGDFSAGRLATIHNLRFYSILMEKLRGIGACPAKL